MQDQQSQFINLVYDNKDVFSLHDEYLGYCDLIKHTILTMTEKPVYLPHCTIPRQLQGKMHKRLDTWLCQGIRRPSKSPYASQVVIVCRKSGEALQAMHSSNWFMSFDLTQGYLQLAMEDGDIQKTDFRASSSGLCEFTHMPVGLSNAGSSFSHLMEQCLGDQQFVTLLLYLEDICIFAPKHWKKCWTILIWCLIGCRNSIWRSSLKNVTSLTPVFYSWAMYYHQKEYLQTPEK